MFNAFTDSVKQRIISELRNFWSYDPNYRDDLVPHIQGKYSVRDRPQMGIIVKNSSATPFQLSADNFQATIISHVHLAKLGNFPGLSLEWVIEDRRAIAINQGTFPTPAGLYYIVVEKEPFTIGGLIQDRLVFYVDPLLEASDETPIKASDTVWQLANAHVAGTLQLFELPGNIKLFEGVNYTLTLDGEGNPTGEIVLAEVLPNGLSLSADYLHPGTSSGPFLIRENHSNVAAIPGVVLAFGRRVEGGDRLVVVVTDRRQPSALEYGGRWEISLDIDIMARDPTAQDEILRKTMIFLWGIARSHLSDEGIEILTVTHGGEAEEIYDENGDDYFFNASLSVSLYSDWAIHVPLTGSFSRVSMQTLAQAAEAAGLTPEELIAQEEGLLRQVVAIREFRDPFFVGRNQTFEVIR